MKIKWKSIDSHEQIDMNEGGKSENTTFKTWEFG